MRDADPASEPGPPDAGGTRWLFWTIGLLLLAVVFLYASWPETPAGPSAIQWTHDLKAGLAKAARNNQLVLIDFHATWCEPCRMMDLEVFSHPDVAEALANWVTVKIDCDKQPGTAQRYGIRALPTFIVLSPKADVLVGFSGVVSAQAFIERVKSAGQRWAGTTDAG